MLSLSLALVAALAPLALAQEQCNGLEGPAQDACNMQAAFGGSTIVPDVVAVFEPQGALYLKYGTVTVGGAQQLSPSRTLTAPTTSFSPSNSSVTTTGPFLLVIVDADSSKPNTVQWMAQDMTVRSGGVLDSTTSPAAPYLAPNPESTTTSERIVALLYNQPDNFKLPSSASDFPNTATGSRIAFDLKAFVRDAELGDPIAGSFFKSTNDGTITGTPTAAAVAASGATPASASSSSPSSNSSSSSKSSKSSSQSSSTSSSPSSSPSTSHSFRVMVMTRTTLTVALMVTLINL